MFITILFADVLNFALVNYMILHSYLKIRISKSNNSHFEAGWCKFNR
jgi:hypothetical protein